MSCFCRRIAAILGTVALLLATGSPAPAAPDQPSGDDGPVASPSQTESPSQAATGEASADDSEWRFKPLAEIRLDSTPPSGELPADRSVHLFTPPVGPESATPVARTRTVFQWKPTNLAYQPLYFDDVPLERYGQSVLPLAQPLLSGAHFFGMFPIMPYKIGIDRTHDPIYTLGYYRVGSDVPPLRQRLPLERDALFFEAATCTGLIFAVP